MSTESKSPVTAAVTSDKADDLVEPGTSNPGSIVLRSVTVALDSDAGKAFITDLARNVEGLLSDTEIKDKWELSDEAWTELASNLPLLTAVRAERDRRIHTCEAAQEAAQRHFARAPGILARILNDEHVLPRHRIEAARELRQTAMGGGDAPVGPREIFKIIIDLGGDTQVIEAVVPAIPAPVDDGEVR